MTLHLSQAVVRSCRYCSGDQSCRPCEGCNLEGGSTNRLGPLRREARQPRARQRFSLNIGCCCSELLMIVFQGCRSASRRDDRQWAVDNGLEGARSMLAGGLFGLSRSSGNLSVACLPVRLPGIRKRGSSTVSQRIARRGEERGQAVGKRPRGDRVAARRRATTDELGSHVREEGVESEYIPGCQPRAEG